MVHIHGEIVINRPLAEVFDVVADTSREPRYNPRMHHAEQITNGPIGVGTRFHAETSNASANCSASCRRFVEVIVGNESRGATRRGLKDSTAVIAAGAAPRPETRLAPRISGPGGDADFGAGEQVRPVPEPKRGGPRYGTHRGGPTPAAPSGGSAGRGRWTTGRLRAHVAGNRFFYRVHQTTSLLADPGRFSL
jgi:hypothetical protein